MKNEIKEVIFASGNLSKYNEIQNIYKLFKDPIGIKILSIHDMDQKIEDVEETGQTFLENALIKATFFWEKYKRPVISEDSGLCVPILGGRPGIYSSRYGASGGRKLDGKSRNLKLLEEMEHVKSWEDRKSYFQAVMVFILNDFEKWIFNRKWYGYIQYKTEGEKGFGYDPIFFLPEYEKTAGCLDSEIKNRISHRGQSFLAFLEKLTSYLSS